MQPGKVKMGRKERAAPRKAQSPAREMSLQRDPTGTEARERWGTRHPQEDRSQCHPPSGTESIWFSFTSHLLLLSQAHVRDSELLRDPSNCHLHLGPQKQGPPEY